ncbi:MAG: YigZ family protein [Ignavibacteriae bacterium]|nr:YigZ family protein [Ignavibacteriota bacterium]
MGKIKDSYLTLSDGAVSEIKIQKSKFIAQAFPVNSQLKFQEILDNVRKAYYDAAHHPFAYRLGITEDNFRYSDDGEPTGSAGKPVLDAIDKFELTDVCVIVTRYFGGVKLGVGGLRRAFFEATEECLKTAKIEERLITEEFEIESDYNQMNVIMKILEQNDANILSNNSDEKVRLKCSSRLSVLEAVKKELVNATSGNVVIKG